MSELLIAKIEDKARRTQDKNIPTALGFLDSAEQAIAEGKLKLSQSRYFLSGGYEGAERKFLFFLPEYLDEEFFPLDEYITAFSAKVPFGKPTHRDFLGSILGLGIERECIGDILVGEETVFLVDKKIAAFIAENLKKVGRLGVFLKEIPLTDIKAVEEPFDEVEVSVASLRLDALCAAAFNISRSAAVSAIESGQVSKNWLPCENVSEQLSEGDLISFRGKGRAKLFRIGGTSKKGRTFANFKVYIKNK